MGSYTVTIVIEIKIKNDTFKFLVFQIMINSIWYINTYQFIIQIPETLNL